MDSSAGPCGDGTRANFVEQGDVGRVAEATVARIARHFAEHAELDQARNQTFCRRPVDRVMYLPARAEALVLRAMRVAAFHEGPGHGHMIGSV